MKKKILFITPSLGRTGSEMVLWYLLSNLDQTEFTPYLFCLRKGELFDQLPDNIAKSVAYKGSGQWYKKAYRGILKMFGIEPVSYQLKSIQAKFKADIWYVNTILIPQAHPVAKALEINIVTHIHELMFAYAFIKAQEFKNIINYSNTIIGCSDLVCDQFKNLQHPNIKLQNSFIDEHKINPDKQRIEALKKELGINIDDFVWVISGTVAYMKGLDDVLAIIEHFKNEPIKIIWIGGGLNNGLDYYMQTIAETKYPGKLIFTGAVAEDYYNYMSLGNGFLLLSKEESFSLVMLEAAYLGIPIVAFNIGVVKHFIREGMGKVVNSRNVLEMIEAMNYLHQNPTQDTQMLKNAAMQFTAKNQLPKFQTLLSSL